MASEVGICVLALSHIGEEAITSLDPDDDSSVNAARCALFYPMARDQILEDHDWNFATKRAALEETEADIEAVTEWAFGYQVPEDLVRIIAVMPEGASDDYGQLYPGRNFDGGSPYLPSRSYYQPADFCLETIGVDDAVERIIYTNAETAHIRYGFTPDVAAFTQPFVTALSFLLASFLAGPIIKGDAGEKKATDCLKKYEYFLNKAKDADSRNRQVRPQQATPAIAAR